MYFLQVLISLFLIALSSPLPSAQKPPLVSLLPAKPIEPPATWSWGKHPNGLGYKAKNGFSLSQCIKNPSMANSLLCEAATKEMTWTLCKENPSVQDTALCDRPGWSF
eukprot:TRINITY_DN40115_c0_g1_i1.p1 TRINITY_DN40115_c0_g1~~TRINITY_DN40115_c0_g1_i1.p1  ORF type:complete len:108 (-),score=26.66 TRINITY_DN40115_c0_g1_i1:37-360(-)